MPSAVAVYTGMETKMALNYQSKSQKRSAVEKYDESPSSFHCMIESRSLNWLIEMHPSLCILSLLLLLQVDECLPHSVLVHLDQ